MITATLRGKYEIERSGRTPRRAHYHQRLAVVATVEKPWHRPKFPGDWTNIALERCSRDHNRSCPDREQEVTLHWHLTIRLSDARLRQPETKPLYTNHRPPPWLTEDATRDRSNRLLDYRAAPAPKLPLNSAVELTPSLALCKLPTPSTPHHRSTETVQYCADTNEPCAKSRPK